MSSQFWESRLARLEGAFEQFGPRLDDFRDDIDRGFEEIDGRLEGIDKRFDGLEVRFDRITWLVLGSAIATITAGFLHH